jgi:hypothetical protein
MSQVVDDVSAQQFVNNTNCPAKDTTVHCGGSGTRQERLMTPAEESEMPAFLECRKGKDGCAFRYPITPPSRSYLLCKQAQLNLQLVNKRRCWVSVEQDLRQGDDRLVTSPGLLLIVTLANILNQSIVIHTRNKPHPQPDDHNIDSPPPVPSTQSCQNSTSKKKSNHSPTIQRSTRSTMSSISPSYPLKLSIVI